MLLVLFAMQIQLCLFALKLAFNILDNLLKYYGDKHLLGRTEGFLQEAFVSNALTCLICISTVKRSDAVS